MPACVVNKIRGTFPKTDDEEYTGYESAEDTDAESESSDDGGAVVGGESDSDSDWIFTPAHRMITASDCSVWLAFQCTQDTQTSNNTEARF